MDPRRTWGSLRGLCRLDGDTGPQWFPDSEGGTEVMQEKVLLLPEYSELYVCITGVCLQPALQRYGSTRVQTRVNVRIPPLLHVHTCYMCVETENKGVKCRNPGGGVWKVWVLFEIIP